MTWPSARCCLSTERVTLRNFIITDRCEFHVAQAFGNHALNNAISDDHLVNTRWYHEVITGPAPGIDLEAS